MQSAHSSLFAVTMVIALAAPSSSSHCGRGEDRGRDAVVASHVEGELERRGMEDVEVTVDGNAIVLSGLVRDEAERTRAQAIARDVSGFVEVRDRLIIRHDGD